MFEFSAAIRRAPSPDGASSGGQRMSCVPFVISSGRSICGTSGERSISSIAMHAWRTVYGSLRPIDVADELEVSFPSADLDELRADRLRRDVIGELVPGHRFGHPPPDAEERATVDVRLGERDVGARRDRPLSVRRDEGDRDHAAHRRAVDEDACRGSRASSSRAPSSAQPSIVYFSRG